MAKVTGHKREVAVVLSAQDLTDLVDMLCLAEMMVDDLAKDSKNPSITGRQKMLERWHENLKSFNAS